MSLTRRVEQGYTSAPGALSPRRRSFGRVVRDLLFSCYRQVDGIAPSLTALLLRAVQKVLRFQQRIWISRARAITLRAEGARFQLYLSPGCQLAYADYFPLAASGEVYEPVATACLTRVMRALPEASLMDIGAFMGYFTCYYAALFRDQRRVWAVESNADFCDAIRTAIALNGFTKARVLHAALSDRTEAVTIDDRTVLPSSRVGAEEQRTHTIKLDELCAREGIAPTVVKIDVHGYEGKVLRGMSRTLEGSIEVLLLELHTVSVFKPHSPEVTRIESLDWLERLGFSLWHVSGYVQEHRMGAASYLQQGRFAYAPLTGATRQYLLFDRQCDVLVLATKTRDIATFLGSSVDLAEAVG